METSMFQILYSDNVFSYCEIIAAQLNIWLSFICLIQNSQFDIFELCVMSLVKLRLHHSNCLRQLQVMGCAVSALPNAPITL